MNTEHPSFEVLEDLATGGMSGRSGTGVRAHLADCGKCASWIDTYLLLSEGLGSGAEGAEHPSSEELAGYAAQPEGLGSADFEQIDDHLLSCDECREQLDLVTQAIAEAREPARPVRPAHFFASPVRVALAASLLLLLGLAWALRPQAGSQETTVAQVVSGDSSPATHPIEVSAPALASAPAPAPAETVTAQEGSSEDFRGTRLAEATDPITPPAVAENEVSGERSRATELVEPSDPIAVAVVFAEEVSGESFRGTHVVEAIDSITADAAIVETGGDVIFRAGESVVLNNGFEVGNGALFQVDLGPASAATSG